MLAQDEQLLALSHLFRHLEPQERSLVAQTLRRARYQAGQIIARQGSRVQGLCLITQGAVRPQERSKGGKWRPLPLRRVGDVFGAREVLQRKPWQATIVAKEPTTILCWPTTSLLPLLRKHPELRQTLELIAQTHRLAARIRLPALEAGETLYALLRRHPIHLLLRLLPAAAMLLGAAALFVLIPDQVRWGLWGAAGLLTGAMLMALWRWLDWRNDYYLVTNMRVIWIEKIIGIYESRHEAPMHWVLSVGVRTGLLGRILGYGDVLIRTYTGHITFHNVGYPQAIAAIIEEHWRRAVALKDKVDRKKMAAELRARLEGPQPLDQALEEMPAPEPGEQAPAPAIPSPWGLEMRFEEHGVITYRKHWVILAGQLAAPGLLLLVGLGLATAKLAGLIQALALSAVLAGSGVLVVLGALWWLYRFMDWANDIYQISPTHVLHISKKPLASEERNVAPLDNILGTEVDRKGLLRLMLNYGDVVAHVGSESFVFRGVFDPNSVQADIVRAQQQSIRRRQETERARRQAEVVEWLAAYHEETAARPAKPGERGHQENDHPEDSHNT